MFSYASRYCPNYKDKYDETQNKSLLEHYGAYTLLGRPCPANSAGQLVHAYWVTTKKDLNRWNCWNETLNWDACTIEKLFLRQRVMSLELFSFIGTDIVHGEEANKWQYLDMNDNKNYHFSHTMWVIEKELGGVQQAVPLKYEYRWFDTDTGETIKHFFQDYFNFNTSAIDPKTFDIKKGLKRCTTVGDPGLEDEVTMPIGHRGGFARFTGTHSEPHASQEEQLQIFSRHLRYPEVVGHVGSRDPQRVRRLVNHSYKPSGGLPFPYSAAEVEALSKDLPEHFDWRDYGAVTPIKDVNYCDAVYAFAATDAVASALFLHNNRTLLMRLSEQAIIDCSWEVNLGCHGYMVNMRAQLDWIQKHGLPTELDYGDYQNENGYCKLANVKTAVNISGYVEVPSMNEKALKLAVFNHGPVTVKVGDRVLWDVRSRRGVFNEPTCDSDHNSYFAQVVGWGTLDGEKFWIVKGPAFYYYFNFPGYALIAIDKNICGVMDDPVYVTI